MFLEISHLKYKCLVHLAVVNFIKVFNICGNLFKLQSFFIWLVNCLNKLFFKSPLPCEHFLMECWLHHCIKICYLQISGLKRLQNTMLKLSKHFLIGNEVQIALQWQREKSKSGLLSFTTVVAKSPFSSPLKGNLHSPSFSLWGTWAHTFQRSNQTIKLEGLWNQRILFFSSKVVSLPQRQVNVNWGKATLQWACCFESQVEVVDRGLLSTDVLSTAQQQSYTHLH